MKNLMIVRLPDGNLSVRFTEAESLETVQHDPSEPVLAVVQCGQLPTENQDPWTALASFLCLDLGERTAGAALEAMFAAVANASANIGGMDVHEGLHRGQEFANTHGLVLGSSAAARAMMRADHHSQT